MCICVVAPFSHRSDIHTATTTFIRPWKFAYLHPKSNVSIFNCCWYISKNSWIICELNGILNRFKCWRRLRFLLFFVVFVMFLLSVNSKAQKWSNNPTCMRNHGNVFSFNLCDYTCTRIMDIKAIKYVWAKSQKFIFSCNVKIEFDQNFITQTEKNVSWSKKKINILTAQYVSFSRDSVRHFCKF